MRVRLVGTGDAFGTGGRYQTCFLVEVAGATVMLDCGATTTLALEAMRRDPNTIEHIVITHLHGDHFGGVVFMVVQALFGTARKAPLTVYGPPGIEARYRAAMEALYPGFLTIPMPFALRFVEMRAGTPIQVGPLTALAVEVDHPSGAPAHGIRLTHGGRTVAFTGDTRWTETLPALGTGADVFLLDCYAFDVTTAAHLTWSIIRAALDRLGAKRYVLVHMNADMLARRAEVRDPRVTCGEDGMVLDL